jgi:hypothetical protein
MVMPMWIFPPRVAAKAEQHKDIFAYFRGLPDLHLYKPKGLAAMTKLGDTKIGPAVPLTSSA